MINVIILGCFEVTFDVHLIGVFEFHGSVGVETFTQVVGQVFELLGTFAALEDEGLGRQALLLGVRLLVGTNFFLSNRSIGTLRPPTFGICCLKLN